MRGDCQLIEGVREVGFGSGKRIREFNGASLYRVNRYGSQPRMWLETFVELEL